MTNPYKPELARIEKITQETPDTKTFRVVFCNEEYAKSFTYNPGQFQLVSVFGVGEATFCLTSSPSRKGYIEFSAKRVGSVTTAVHELAEGSIIGVRAPLGNHFPHENWHGKNLLFVGGGIGMAPMRSLLNFCLDNRSDYKDINVIYGSRTPSDLSYEYEYDSWRKGGNLYLTVDSDDEEWKGHVGHVPGYLKELAPSSENTIAITCGPPIMIKFALIELAALGFSDDQIYTTLELRMKCGIGKCGRCNIGTKFVCTDGPVFSYAELNEMPQEF